MKKRKQKKLKQRNLLVIELMSPLYHQRVEKKRKGKGSYKREKRVIIEVS